MSGVQLRVNVTSDDFPDADTNNYSMLANHFFLIICTYPYHPFLPLPNTHPKYTASLNFSSEDQLFANEYQRSYECREVDVHLNNTNTSLLNTTDVILELNEWQVQAFEFRHDGLFGNGALICCRGGIT